MVAFDQLTGSPILVAAYRDTGPQPSDTSSDIRYGTGTAQAPSIAAEFGRRASLAGFSYSVDGGRSWTAPPKIRPPSDFPILWGDARLAVDAPRPWRVAMVNLAVSDQEFTTAQGYDPVRDVVTRWPNAQSEITAPPLCTVQFGAGKGCDLVSSVCVTTSETAGRSFPTPTCKAIRRCSLSNAACVSDSDCTATGGGRCTPRGTDQPTVTFSSDGSLYVALWETDELNLSSGHDRLTLFHVTQVGTTWTWSEVPIATQMTASYFPKIRTDRLGRIWLAATTDRSAAAGIRLCEVDAGGTCEFQSEVTLAQDTVIAQPDLRLPTGTKIRTGQALDFRVNVVNAFHATDMRFVYHHRTSDTSPIALHVLQCTLDDIAPTPSCQLIPAWGTDELGQDAVQPTLSLVDRSTAQDGSDITWDYGFITGPAPDATANPPFAYLYSSTLTFNLATVRQMPNLPPRVCHARYPGGAYWGDFIGFAGFRDAPTGIWAHLATWSSDNNRGCSAPISTNIWQGRQLHVAASTWTDLRQ